MRLRFWKRPQDDVKPAPILETPPEWLSDSDPRRRAAQKKEEGKKEAQSALAHGAELAFNVAAEAPGGLVVGAVGLLGFGIVQLTRKILGRRGKD